MTLRFERPLTKEELRARNSIRKIKNKKKEKKKKEEEELNYPLPSPLRSSNLLSERSLNTRVSLDSESSKTREIRFNIQVLGCENNTKKWGRLPAGGHLGLVVWFPRSKKGNTQTRVAPVYNRGWRNERADNYYTEKNNFGKCNKNRKMKIAQ